MVVASSPTLPQSALSSSTAPATTTTSFFYSLAPRLSYSLTFSAASSLPTVPFLPHLQFGALFQTFLFLTQTRMMPSDLCGIALCVARCFGCHEDGTGPCSEAVQPVVRRECGNLMSIAWNATLGGVVNVLCLCCNAERLKDNMRRLMAEKVDVNRKASAAAAQQGGECLTVVKTWANRVDELNDKVEELHKSVHSCMVAVKFLCLSYSAKDYLDKVEELRKEMTGKSFIDLVGPAAPPATVSQNTPSAIHPDHPRFSEAWQHLMNDQIGIVGVSGDAGTGKTALLQALNNEPSPPGVRGFDAVILISLAEYPSVGEVQEEIGYRLGVPLSAAGAADEKSRARALNKALSRMRFMLLLDDVHDEGILQTLKRVGIPVPPPRKSKIVFATASNRIVGLGHREIVLERLDGAQCWEVFYKNLSEKAKENVARDADLKATAMNIVQRCDGCPLVLISCAKALSRIGPSLDEWDNYLDAIESPTSSIDRLTGMAPILLSLQRKYDLLPSDSLRKCFLYCCLFPERCGIDKTQLVEYWVGEGLLDMAGKKTDRIEIARIKGSTCIRDLADVSLLCDLDKAVVLPESARRLAVSLTSEGSGRFVVVAGKDYLEVREVESWSDAERVSLMQNDIQGLPDNIPECPNLRTLLINNNPRLKFATDGTNLASSSSPSPAAASASTATDNSNHLASFSSSSPAAAAPAAASITTDSTNLAASSSSPAAAAAAAASIATDSTNIAASSSAAAAGAPPPSSSSSSIEVYNARTPLFELMKGLRVLDLSSTSVKELPSDIRLLGELQYLNLSKTNINDLPEGLGRLAKLRQLDLSGTKKLKHIRHGIISKLKELQALNLYDSGYYLCFGEQREYDGWECLLSALQKLDELGVNIKTPFPWKTLPGPGPFVRFQSSARFLKIAGSDEDSSTSEEQVFDVCQFPILEVLQLSSLPFSRLMAARGAGTQRPPLQRLRHLYLSTCDERKDLEWVRKLLPRLAIHGSGDGRREWWRCLENVCPQVFRTRSS